MLKIGLPPRAIIVGLFLASRANSDGTFAWKDGRPRPLAASYVAAHLNMSPRTVERSLSDLQDAYQVERVGQVATSAHARSRANVYRLRAALARAIKQTAADDRPTSGHDGPTSSSGRPTLRAVTSGGQTGPDRGTGTDRDSGADLETGPNPKPADIDERCRRLLRRIPVAADANLVRMRKHAERWGREDVCEAIDRRRAELSREALA